jgi:uncharacterized protein involved in exopolysaccharide biosynthesis
MIDLERELGRWREEMAAAGLAPDILIELEEHLREDIERQVNAGADISDAVRLALERIGKPGVLRSEFDLIGSPSIADTLRRNKWKLLLCSAAGLLAAIVLHVLRPAPYHSEAKLFIRMVLAEPEIRGLDEPIAIQPGQIFAADHEKIMTQQLEILGSSALAQRMAENIGANRILKKIGGGDDLIRATAAVERGLYIAVAKNSSVIQLGFRHPDSGVVQAVLREAIDGFLKMHVAKFRVAMNQPFPVGTVTNISLVKAPSPPLFDFAALFRTRAWFVAAGLLAGFGWVFAARPRRFRSRVAS